MSRGDFRGFTSFDKSGGARIDKCAGGTERDEGREGESDARTGEMGSVSGW